MSPCVYVRDRVSVQLYYFVFFQPSPSFFFFSLFTCTGFDQSLLEEWLTGSFFHQITGFVLFMKQRGASQHVQDYRGYSIPSNKANNRSIKFVQHHLKSQFWEEVLIQIWFICVLIWGWATDILYQKTSGNQRLPADILLVRLTNYRATWCSREISEFLKCTNLYFITISVHFISENTGHDLFRVTLLYSYIM